MQERTPTPVDDPNAKTEAGKMSATTYPITANPCFLILVVLGTWALSYVIASTLGLGKTGWKRVDYVWLSVGAVGLVSSGGDVRRFVAANVVDRYAERRAFAYSRVVQDVQMFAGPAVCRSFMRTQFSPPNLGEIQREHDVLCQAGISLYADLPTVPPDSLDLGPFLRLPLPADPVLGSLREQLVSSLVGYRSADSAFQSVKQAGNRTEEEEHLLLLGPFFIASALGIRLAKVEGDIGAA